MLDLLIGWQGVRPSTRSRLLRALCSGIRPQSLISNSLTLIILAGLIIAETRDPVHVAWVATVIAGGLMPRVYAAYLRRQGDFGHATERKALNFLFISVAYGLLWGAGPFLFLPELSGSATGIFLFIMVFGTIMGPYAVVPGILYVRLATTGTCTLVAAALYTTPQITFACVVVSIWLVLRTDVWRGYHRNLRLQLELQEDLEARQSELETAVQSNRQANRLLKRMADTDPLTGAYNRRELTRRLDALPGPAALIMLDIDRFKEINDSFGHHIGDGVLIELVALIQEMLRKNDLLVRMGGEEFAIVLEDVDESNTWAFAERIRGRIERHRMMIGGNKVNITVSVGLAVVGRYSGGDRTADLLREADAALYRAKHKGRNRTQIAGPGTQVTAPGQSTE